MSSLCTRLTCSVILLNLFVFTLMGLSIHQSHRQYQERAEITTQNLTQTLESDIASAIKTSDTALFAVIDEYKHQQVDGGVDGKVLNAYIDRVHSRLPEIDGLRITDAQGALIYGNDVTPGAQTVADRPHFVRLRDDPEAGLVITNPQQSRANQKWVIALARRIDQPDGSFGGIAIAAITLKHFSRTFSALNVGPHGAVALRDGELGLILRYPALQEIGSTIGKKPVAREFREMVAAGNTDGTFTVHAGSDNVERAYSYRKIGPYPLYIVVGLAAEDYLAEWRNEAITQAALATLFALITSLAAWLIYRIGKRQLNSVEALARQEIKFRTVADFTFDWEYWQGPLGEILYMTPSCERVTGHTQAEFVADPGLLLHVIHPEDRHVMEQHLHDIVHPMDYEEGAQVDFRILRRDGEIRWIAHRCRAVCGQDGEFMGRRVGNRDITERKQAETELHDLNRDFVTFLENATDFIYFKDRDSRFRFCSQTLANVTGHASWRDMIGKHDLEVFPKDVAQIYYEEELPVFREGRSLLNKIDPYYDASGNPGWVSTNKWPVLDSEGKKVIGIFGISRDITEYKRVEEELQHHRQNLEDMVVERTAQLRALTTELAMTEERERRAIAQDLHDDLGQTLAVVKLRLTSLKTPGKCECHDELTYQVKEIVAMVDRANHSVRSLSMQLSPPVLSQFGMVPALEWLAEEMQRSYGLHVHIHNDGNPTLLDETLSSSLFRTVRELLINVSKHAQVDAAEVSVLTEGDKLVITVADAGIGLGVKQSLTPSTEGGYGLFSVRERLNAIGGEMQIDSQPGDGTLVVLTLPLDAMKGRPGK